MKQGCGCVGRHKATALPPSSTSPKEWACKAAAFWCNPNKQLQLRSPPPAAQPRGQMEQPGCIAGGSGQLGLRSLPAGGEALLLPLLLMLTPRAADTLSGCEPVVFCSTTMNRIG